MKGIDQKVIVVTGAESTGKSTLSKSLAEYFNVPFIPEVARSYVESLESHYTYTDIENIAKLQISSLRELHNKGDRYIILDTWLIVTKVWFEVVYNKVPDWLQNEIEATPIDLFLVCDTNLPWIRDTLRENGGEMRNVLQKRYIDLLEQFKFRYAIVTGTGSRRLQNAIRILKEAEF